MDVTGPDAVISLEDFLRERFRATATEPPADALDPPIRPLVAAINANGWARTVFSCAGHPEEPDAVTTGRRQAHVDVIVRDARAWKAWTRAVRREAPVVVRTVEDRELLRAFLKPEAHGGII